MENDVEIKPTKLVKGHGLDKLLVDSNFEYLGLHLMVEQLVPKESQAGQEKEQIMDRYADSVWYVDIVYFLLYLRCPEHLDKK